MPIINPSPAGQSLPLPPVGEYVGIAKKVSTSRSNEKRQTDGTMETHQVFRIPLTTHTGERVTAFMHLKDSCAYFVNQMLRSGEMVPPEDGSPCILTADHLENRKFYFAIEHGEWNGVMRANVKFHTPGYAIQQNPSLEGVSFPGEAPRGIRLAPAPRGGEAPPASFPDLASSLSGEETLTEEEFRHALEEARRIKREGVI